MPWVECFRKVGNYSTNGQADEYANQRGIAFEYESDFDDIVLDVGAVSEDECPIRQSVDDDSSSTSGDLERKPPACPSRIQTALLRSVGIALEPANCKTLRREVYPLGLSYEIFRQTSLRSKRYLGDVVIIFDLDLLFQMTKLSPSAASELHSLVAGFYQVQPDIPSLFDNIREALSAISPPFAQIPHE